MYNPKLKQAKQRRKLNRRMFNEFYKHLVLGKSHGLGVFAGKSFRPQETVEIAPCIHNPDMYSEAFGDYVFESSVPGYASTLVLGYGSLYNHAEQPNLDYYTYNERFMLYYANRPIKLGEELTINYGPGWWDGRDKD